RLDGAVEISLIGQDTTSYGLGEDRLTDGLAGLLRKLNGVDGLAWIRLMYVYPSVFSDEMIDAIAECDRVCNYIDIPLQHINDRMLKAMHRRVDRRTTEGLLQRIRDRIPGVSIRTTLIAGFPGETDAEFEELTDFIEGFRFDALGVFPYSQEPDTPAGRMKDQIPAKIKEQRVETLMLAQQEVAFALADSRVGSRFDVLVDGKDEQGRLVARHAGQAPTVDSVTLIGNSNAKSGQFVNVRCTDREGYDLVAMPTEVSLPVLGT
ncbi:MAG: radical SAM protein, partial [Planctomycetes bacterium]|nr:radical SAM protein [Planctomycetota bacterium]